MTRRVRGRERAAAAGTPTTLERIMRNPLDSITGTILCGLALTAVLVVIVRSLSA
jgi:hypothetical protein